VTEESEDSSSFGLRMTWGKNMGQINKTKFKLILGMMVFLVLLTFSDAVAQSVPKLSVELGKVNNSKDLSYGLQLLLIITVLALAPSILIMVTSFTRIVVVLSFLKQSLGTPQLPPNQLIFALALILTFFVMSPVIFNINQNALQPYLKGELNQDQAYEKGIKPLREFMFNQTREKDLALFVQLSKLPQPQNREEIPTYVLIPGFVISELRIAFQIGFLIFIPFLIIDLVVASVITSMGMAMLPPAVISLPFKVLLFVLVDGWYLLVKSLVTSFR
jgi:flagellar biosynthetic protein FliP